MVASSFTGTAPAATASSPTNNSTNQATRGGVASANASSTNAASASNNSATFNDTNNSSSNTAAQATSANAPPADDPTARGRPYYEKLRRSLKQTLDKKRELDASMLAIETRIARVENAYLEETSAAGNIIKGFDNYIKASGTTGPTQGGASTGTATRRKGGISDSDRIFSRSSLTWVKKDEEPRVLVTNNSSGAGTVSSSATPSRSGTPGRGSGSARGTPAASAAASTKMSKSTKKKAALTAAAAAAAAAASADKEKDKDKKDDGGEERPAKRGKVSWGRD